MSWTDGVKNFLTEKFLTPLRNEYVHYNPFNTTFYALLFGVAAAYVGKPLLQLLEVEIDRKFVKALAPYVFLGGAVRTLEDSGIVSNFLLVSPFIYLIMFVSVVSILVITRKIDENFGISYEKLMLPLGVILLLATVLIVGPALNYSFLAVVGLIYAAIIGILFLGTKYWKKRLGISFLIPVFAHYWDGVTSFAVIWFSNAPFWEVEKHVLGRQLMYLMDSIGVFPPVGMLVMKTLVVIPIVYYIDTKVEPEFDRKYFLFLVALLGFALGTRNLLSFLAVN